jgi:hypothetical protein
MTNNNPPEESTDSTLHRSSLRVLDELSERGVKNPKVVDLIRSTSDAVELVMIEDRPWGSSPLQSDELAEKFNNYLDYILDGFLFDHYPQYKDSSIRIVLEYASPIGPLEEQRLQFINNYCIAHSIEFVASHVSFS